MLMHLMLKMAKDRTNDIQLPDYRRSPRHSPLGVAQPGPGWSS
jgi:hypothetical protein